MKRFSRKKLLPALFCLGLFATTSAQAQGYPDRPIRIVVPYGAGGIGDFTARALAKELTPLLNTTLVVENKPGASGLIAMNGVKAAPPDGYTLVMSSNTTLSAARHLFKALAYDPMKDFTHVGMIGTFGSVALVSAAAPYKTVPEFVEHAKKNPSKAFYAYVNASSQVPAELLNASAGIKLEGVGYKEVGQAATDLISGQIPFMFLDTVAAAPLLQGGRVVPMAITQAMRLPTLPAVPPMADFYPGFEFNGYISVSVPGGTPAPIVEKLNAAIRAALDAKGFREAIESNGMTAHAMTVPELTRFIEGENEKWAAYAATAKLEPQ